MGDLGDLYYRRRAKGRHGCSSKEVLEQWRKLRESEHHPEGIMHATHVEILISAKSPIADKMRLTRMRTETPTNYQEEVVHGDHAFFLLCLCPTLEEIEPAPQPHLL